MANAWLEYVKSYRENHPNVSYKDALVLASQTYRRTHTVGEGQEGGFLGVVAPLASMTVASNALSQPVANAILKSEKLKPKEGSKREYDTKLIAEQGWISAVPEMVQADKARRKAKREERQARQKL